MNKELQLLSERNHKIALKYFKQNGMIPNDGKKYVLHHKDVNMRHCNPERYHQWNIEDLEVMDYCLHSKFHGHLHAGKNSPNYGKHLSLQHRINIGKGNKGKRGIPVNQYTLDMVFVKRYNSISEAASTLNIDCTGICDCCKGRRKSAVGFIWKYANE